MLGKKLAELRKQNGLSQYELADRLGFSRGKLANYEQGTREPDFGTLLKIADYFGVSTDDLLGHDINKLLNNDAEKEEAEFQAFVNDPTLQKWYKELPKSNEEDLQKLRTIWEMIKNDVDK